MAFKLCRLIGYIDGTIVHPDPHVDAEGAENWDMNDILAQKLIQGSTADKQVIHTNALHSAKEMWNNLESVYQLHGSMTVTQWKCEIHHISCKEGDSIAECFTKIKTFFVIINP